MLVLSVAEFVCFFLQIFKMILLRRFTFFPVLLRMTSCCCLVHHLSADDETSDVLKRPRKMDSHVHRRSQDFLIGGPKPQITCNDVIRNFRKVFLWGKDIVEWKS